MQHDAQWRTAEDMVMTNSDDGGHGWSALKMIQNQILIGSRAHDATPV
jgi:hypothetical protein